VKRTPSDANADSGASDALALLAKYTTLLDERDGLEWPKLFDSEWRDMVLEDQDGLLRMASQVASAVERFVTEFGRPPKAPTYVDKARRLAQSLQELGGDGTLEEVRLLWLEFAADAQSAGIVRPDPIDRLLETADASMRGKLSGATRRAQHEETLDSAAAVWCEMQKQNPFKRHTRADIERQLGKRLPSRTTLTAIVTRAREAAVKK
jgi:hypothetical protein